MDNETIDNEQGSVQSSRTIRIRLPRISGLSVQTLILVLLIGVGGLQTVQLYGLKNSVAQAKVKPAVSAPASGSGSSLQNMVGGC